LCSDIHGVGTMIDGRYAALFVLGWRQQLNVSPQYYTVSLDIRSS
jgi:hypothetical protein